MAVSVLTLEINSGIDIWSHKSDETFLLFVCPECELGTLTDQEEGSGRKSDE